MDILNLGAGLRPMAHAINHDRVAHAPYIDLTFDLEMYPWPLSANSFDLICAENLIEHLSDFLAFFNECWRILRPHGQAKVMVPRWDHINVPIDPTHKRGYHPESFHFLDPDTGWGKHAMMYTPYKWKLVEVRDLGSDIRATLQVRKP